MSIEQVIHSYPGVFGVLMFLIGLVAGNWLAIGRDKRKEFNSAALPIREWLLAEIENPFPARKFPTRSEIDQFAYRLNWFSRYRFNLAYEQQQREREKILKKDSMGGVFYADKRHLIEILKDCLKFTKLK